MLTRSPMRAAAIAWSNHPLGRASLGTRSRSAMRSATASETWSQGSIRWRAVSKSARPFAARAQPQPQPRLEAARPRQGGALSHGLL